jgi:hypothetical protein
MSQGRTASTITMKTKEPEAGPTAVITAMVLLCAHRPSPIEWQ